MTQRLRLLLATLAILTGAGPGRAASPPPVGADHAMVVTGQALASQVGIDVLRQGGTVVDAAVAVGYALAVVYPAAGNLGGGGFMTLRFADGRTTFLDFREKAPLGATAGMFLDPAGAVVEGRSTDSWLAVGVPGSVAGLEAARERYGTLSREALIAPALRLAREGFVLTDADARLFQLGAKALGRDPQAAAIFLDHGEPLRAGDRLRQPALARTLAIIARDGPGAVYGGSIGREIAAAAAAGGGLIAAEDFAHYAVREEPTIACSYRGYMINSAPPPSSGGVAVCEILNILEGYDLGAMGFHSAAELHVLAEAMRRAYRDRNSALGDPAFVDNPIARLTDKAYAAALRAGIAPDAATPTAALGAPPPAPEGQQTTHYSIADAAGNAVAVTTTLNAWFGAARVAGDTGILMNNEMDDFTAKPGSANMFGLVQGATNAPAPGKTPLSSMSPTIVTRDGRLVLVIGSPGGSRIITTVVEAIVNLVDHRMTLTEAIDAPRIHMQGLPDEIAAEPLALSADTREVLAREGYTLKDNQPWGMAEGVLAGAPALAGAQAGGPQAAEGHALAIPAGPHAHALYGARDDRGEAGAAVGY